MQENKTGNGSIVTKLLSPQTLTDMGRKKITNNNKINQKTINEMTGISKLYIVTLDRN